MPFHFEMGACGTFSFPDGFSVVEGVLLCFDRIQGNGKECHRVYLCGLVGFCGMSLFLKLNCATRFCRINSAPLMASRRTS